MVHESVGFLDKLWKWDLAFCDSLQNLPNNLRLKSLEEFNLSGCFKLEKFPNIHPEMKRLKNLDLSLSGIRGLPSSIGYLTALESLDIQNCKQLRQILRLPQFIKRVEASNCPSLDAQSSSRLLNQVFFFFKLYIYIYIYYFLSSLI